jgi:hypothetical protein
LRTAGGGSEEPPPAFPFAGRPGYGYSGYSGYGYGYGGYNPSGLGGPWSGLGVRPGLGLSGFGLRR